ncbi:MAG TPA: type II secretion system F family protein [Phycisphaerales bacterium]|nr:type II secretion system F family protein [Phycisphaerales bacterium]
MSFQPVPASYLDKQFSRVSEPMPTFAYKTISGGPAATIQAIDRPSAVRELMRKGITPVSVETVEMTAPRTEPGAPRQPAKARPAGASALGGPQNALFASRAMSRTEVASFIRELATAIQAGLPLVQSLKTISRQGRNDKQRVVLEKCIAEVEHGRSLADAFAANGNEFNELIINMVRAGEASGKLEEVLHQAADLLDRDVKLRRSIMSATLYPFILFIMLVLAVIVIVTFIVPRVLESVKGSAMTLPLPTRIVEGIAGFFGGYWWAIIPAVVVGVYGLGSLYARPDFRLWFDTTILKVPILGRLLRDVAVARFTRTLGTLTSAGVPILQSLRITRGTLGNKAMERVIDEVTEQVAAGKTIADPMEKSGYFPPMLVQIVNLGERSGRLDEMLRQAARSFEERTEVSVKLFTTALPPILVVFLAGCVGFLVLAILLPMLQAQDAIR